MIDKMIEKLSAITVNDFTILHYFFQTSAKCFKNKIKIVCIL